VSSLELHDPLLNEFLSAVQICAAEKILAHVGEDQSTAGWRRRQKGERFANAGFRYILSDGSAPGYLWRRFGAVGD
jgi:hypothetical protein